MHRDLKPHNIVKVAMEDTWKLIDMATCAIEGDESEIHYTLRCAAYLKLVRSATKTHAHSTSYGYPSAVGDTSVLVCVTS